MHKHAPLIRALAENSNLVIQIRHDDDWLDIANPAFDCEYSDYRIKPDSIPQPHRHADLLLALADDPTVTFEYRMDDKWSDSKSIFENLDMRIKNPQFANGVVVNHIYDGIRVVVTSDDGGECFFGTCIYAENPDNKSLLFVPGIEWMRDSFTQYT